MFEEDQQQHVLLLDLQDEETTRGELLLHPTAALHLVVELAVHFEDLVRPITDGHLLVGPGLGHLPPDQGGKADPPQDRPLPEEPLAVHEEGHVRRDLPAPGCRRSPDSVPRCRLRHDLVVEEHQAAAAGKSGQQGRRPGEKVKGVKASQVFTS